MLDLSGISLFVFVRDIYQLDVAPIATAFEVDLTFFFLAQFFV